MKEPIKVIKGYKTSDGRIFEKDQEACEWQSFISVSEEIRQLFKSDGELTTKDLESSDWIIQNRSQLHEILNRHIDS